MPEFHHQLDWYQAHDKEDTQWNDDKVIKVPQHGDEVWYEVDRTEGVSSDCRSGELGYQGRSPVSCSEVEGHHVPLDISRPGFGLL